MKNKTIKKNSKAFYTRRASMLFCLMLAAGTFLIIKLYDLAMYDNTSKLVLSGQYTRSVVAAEHTGFIYDRNGKLITPSSSGGIAIVNPAGSRDKNTAAVFLVKYSLMSFSEVISKLSVPEPFTVTLSVLPEESAPDGVYVYPLYSEESGTFCRHLLGYKDSDGVGRDGIYLKYWRLLASKTGRLSYSFQADASGTMFHSDAFSVKNDGYSDKSGIVLSIDAQMQKDLDEMCDKYLDMGAAVVCNLSDFSICALSSRPLYDSEDIASSLDSDRGELINRAFSLYTPGSVFKTVVAAAALEYEEELYNFEYECTGNTNVSGKIFRCHDLSGHGKQTMKEAYANSCNTYFIALAEQIGLHAICETARKMGLGEAVILDGLYVKGALIPDDTQKYTPAYLANISFGQGDLMTTPMDMLRVFAVCATGRVRDFSLVSGVYEQDEMIYFSEKLSEPVLSDNTVDKLLDMMRFCVTNGTGWQALADNVNTGGKTATAQSGQYKNGEEILHRWFAGVFPIEKPKYAMVVLCDGNGENEMNPAVIFSKFADSVYSED